MNWRIRALGGLLVLTGVMVTAAAPPAAAAIDHQAAVIDAPGPGWVPSSAIAGFASGPVTEDGSPAPAGWSAAPGAPFVGGWVKWFETPSPPTLLAIMVGEYRDGSLARKANDNEDGLFEVNPVDLDEWDDQPADLPHGWAASADSVEGGVPVTTSVVAFTHGPLAVVVLAAGAAPGIDHASLTAIARSELAQVQAVVPASVVAAAEESSLGFVEKVVLGALGGALAGGVGAVVRSRKRRRSQAAYAPSPTMGYGPAAGPYGSYPPPPPNGGYGHLPPPPPSGWDEPAWSSPASAGYPPPPAPGFGGAPAAPPPPPAGAFGASPAPAAPVTLAQQPPCPRCGAEFGRGAECETGCGQPRKSCVVCGTKIWAGALTCSAHSGQA